jgi:hypothetical protein
VPAQAGVEVGERHASVWEGRSTSSVPVPARRSARARRADAAPALRRRLRRARGRLPRPLRPPSGEARRARTTRRLQPTRLAHGHARGRPWAASRRGRALRACFARSIAQRLAPPISSCGHRGERDVLPRARRTEREGLPRRRGGTRLHAGWQAQADFTSLFVGKLSPAPRAGDDPRSRAAGARAAISRRRERSARIAGCRLLLRTSSGARGSTTSACRTSCTSQAARSESSGHPPRRCA